jgi:hypothetical protein
MAKGHPDPCAYFEFLKQLHKNSYFLFTVITEAAMLAMREDGTLQTHSLICSKEESGFIDILVC